MASSRSPSGAAGEAVADIRCADDLVSSVWAFAHRPRLAPGDRRPMSSMRRPACVMRLPIRSTRSSRRLSGRIRASTLPRRRPTATGARRIRMGVDVCRVAGGAGRRRSSAAARGLVGGRDSRTFRHVIAAFVDITTFGSMRIVNCWSTACSPCERAILTDDACAYRRLLKLSAPAASGSLVGNTREVDSTGSQARELGVPAPA